MRWEVTFEAVRVKAETVNDLVLLEELIDRLEVKASKFYDRGVITIQNSEPDCLLQVTFLR